jgi:integrase
MAFIRKRTTSDAVTRYQVVWREPVRDEYGAPTGRTRQTSETFDTERAAKRHLRKVETELDSAAGNPSAAQAKAATPLGAYAKMYFDGLVGSVDPSTIEGYAKVYRTHIAPTFGSKPVGTITTADVTAFRAALAAPHPRRSFVTRGQATPRGNQDSRRQTSRPAALVTRSPKTIKHIIGTLRRILDTALDDRAIQANPVVAGRRHSTKHRTASNASAGSGRKALFRHHPLSANQVAGVADWIAQRANGGQGNSVYALALMFAAHTGVRASELQGLRVQDVTLSDLPGTVGAVQVCRTASKSGGKWTYGTPKSHASTNRLVPLAPWLADDLRDYLTTVHPFAGKHPHAPLFPGRFARKAVAHSPTVVPAELERAEFIARFNWAEPVSADNLYDHYLQPACKALGLGATRWHDLRHSFATMNLSAGEHYMQVSKWLGHSSFVLTLTTYADYINEDDQAAPRVGRGIADLAANVTQLQRRAN